MKLIKKLLSLILLVTMIAAILVSCTDGSKKANDDKSEDNKVDGFDISEYKIVRPSTLANEYLNYIKNFKKIVADNTGADLQVVIDTDQKADPNAKEILIGSTNRKESADLVKFLEKDTYYTIRVSGNKIVILGKTEDTTMKALKDFLDEAVYTSKGGKTINMKSDFEKNAVANSKSMLFDSFTEISIGKKVSVTNRDDLATGLIQYSKIVPLSDGTLLATYENYSYKYVIHRSTDGGATWHQFSTVTDTLNKGYVAEWMPHLYELPVDMGKYKAGTVLLAGTSKNEKDTFTVSTITIHASTDGGKTWETVCNVDLGGGGGEGVWEPYLIYEEERDRLYCFYSDDSDPDHSQKLAYKYSTDLENWHGKDDKVGVDVDPKDAVACSNKGYRPGMTSVVDMGEGGYLMTYEMMASGIPDVQVYYKKTKDLDNWGDPADYGKPVKSTDGHSTGSGPWCAWSPVGGACGTLVVVGKHPVPYHVTDKGAKMFLSFDYGETFVAIDNPIPYDLEATETHCGYSPCVVFSKDGKTLYYVNNPLNKFKQGHDINFVKIEIK